MHKVNTIRQFNTNGAEISVSLPNGTLSLVFQIDNRNKYSISFFFNLGVCIVLRVLNQVKGFRLTQLYLNSSFLLFYSNYQLHISIVRPSLSGNIYIGN
jgi:hypothetical protein